MSSSSENDNDMLSTTDAAKLLRTSRDTVVRMCERGRLPGAEQLMGVGGHWRIPRTAVESFRESTRPKKRAAVA